MPSPRSFDCPDHSDLGIYEIQYTILNLRCAKPAPSPPPPCCIKVLTCIDCTFFIKAWIVPLLVPTSSMSNVIRERTIKCRMLLNKSCEWNLICSRSRLEVISALCCGSYVHSQFLFRLFGCLVWNLVAGYSVFFFFPFSACFFSLPRPPCLSRALAWEARFCVCLRYFEWFFFIFFLTSMFHAASFSHVFGRGWRTWGNKLRKEAFEILFTNV